MLHKLYFEYHINAIQAKCCKLVFCIKRSNCDEKSTLQAYFHLHTIVLP